MFFISLQFLLDTGNRYYCANKLADIGKNYHICSRNNSYFADKGIWIT